LLTSNLPALRIENHHSFTIVTSQYNTHIVPVSALRQPYTSPNPPRPIIR